MSDILKTAVSALDSKKALDIKVIRVEDVTILADYFVIASGSSSTQVRALADEVDFKLSQQGIEPLHFEGKSSDWVLIDYGTVVVHVFRKQSREFYDLERLWQDGEIVDVSKLLDD